MAGSGVAVLWALLAWPGGSELEAGGSLDLRLGQAPTGIATNPAGQAVPTEQNQLLLAATPLLGARWTGETSELRARSATRVLWRPAPYAERRPIFLETLEAEHRMRPSRRSRWQLELRSTYGEEDYTSLLRQFANQPALPPALTMFTANALGDGSWRASRRTTLTLLAHGTYRRSLTDLTQTPESPVILGALPTQTVVVVTPGLRHALDRRTTLEVHAGIGDTHLEGVQVAGATSDRVNLLTFQPEVGLVRDLTRAQQVRLSAGLTYVAVLADPAPGLDWRPLTPIVRADLASRLWRTRASSLRSRLGAEASWYADPVLGLAVWRGTALANLDAQLGPRWHGSLRASFTTDLSAPLDTRLTGGVPLDETVGQVEVPFRYRWSSQLALEFGARFAERGPHLLVDDFAWHYRELWAFVTLSSTTHRTRTTPPPPPPS
jgi:hypothetical protein